MRFNKATAVMVVGEVEPCLEFWKRVGFEVTVSVPEGDRVGFAILVRDGVEIMYQSTASVAKDVPAIVEKEPGGLRSVVYADVKGLDEIERALQGVPLVVPRRKTFYGAEEVIVRDPAGNTVFFAEHA